MEALGTVDACGPGAEEWMGRRVVTCPAGAFGGYAEFCVGPTAMTFAMPVRLVGPEAAAFYFPFHLAWLGLDHRAGLQAGETLLVHAAAGGAGSAALQLGVQRGARVIATAGSPEKVAFCRELGADVAIDYRSESFVDAVRDATDGRGVDVAWDSVGGEVTQDTFKCMAINGRHLLIGFASGIEGVDAPVSPRAMVYGNFSLYGVCLAYVDDPAAVRSASGLNFVSHHVAAQAHDRLLTLVAEGKLRPIVGKEVDFADLPKALEAMERRETIGRVVVRVDT
jgi:NADPH2:quinone reductase